MSFLYPRTIAIRRPQAQAGVGASHTYGGAQASAETPIASGLPASIQVRRERQRNDVGLPGDATKPTWYIFIPRRALALGQVELRDIAVDDLGNRYQVIQPYWDSLGHRLTAELLKA